MNLGGNMSGVPAVARGRGGQGMGLQWRQMETRLYIILCHLLNSNVS